jgi:hypothetical protein
LNLQLVQWKSKYQALFNIAITGAALYVINLLGKAVMFVLYIKKVRVPRWLDILI